MGQWKIIIIFLLMASVVTALKPCEKEMTPSDIPCLLISTWKYPLACSEYEIYIFNETPALIGNLTMDDYGATGYCRADFNNTEVGSYSLNFTSRDLAIINIVEDDNMIIGLTIGMALIVILFIVMTILSKEDKPFLANFFFLGIFIFTTVLSNLLWKITYVNSSPYEPIMLAVYRMILIVSMTMTFIVLTLITIEIFQRRKIEGNPIDAYRDNLNKNE